ncbi:MAG: hypothetical protein LC637_09795 [Xanthomonadaceae bacterium]|nr:hypothetical protein [Xanthomonadaceae bacterium]
MPLKPVSSAHSEQQVDVALLVESLLQGLDQGVKTALDLVLDLENVARPQNLWAHREDISSRQAAKNAKDFSGKFAQAEGKLGGEFFYPAK